MSSTRVASHLTNAPVTLGARTIPSSYATGTSAGDTILRIVGHYAISVLRHNGREGILAAAGSVMAEVRRNLDAWSQELPRLETRRCRAELHCSLWRCRRPRRLAAAGGLGDPRGQPSGDGDRRFHRPCDGDRQGRHCRAGARASSRSAISPKGSRSRPATCCSASNKQPIRRRWSSSAPTSPRQRQQRSTQRCSWSAARS